MSTPAPIEDLGEARAQHYQFAHRILPQIVHRAPRDFLEEARRDGRAFLLRLWDRAGSGAPPAGRVSSEGLSVRIENASGAELVLIEMPPAEGATEAVFVGVAVQSGRKGWLGKARESARYLTLERSQDPDGRPATTLAEWVLDGNGSLRHVEHGAGPAPERLPFLAALCGVLQPGG